MNKTIAGFVILLVLLTGGGFWWYSISQSGASGGIDINNAPIVARGKSLYARDCAACHGKNLEGQTPDWRRPLPDGTFPAPPHDASGHTWHHPDTMLFEITKFGRLRSAPRTNRTTMPAFGGKLSDDEIWSVLTYIKSRWPAEIRRRHDAMNRRHRGAP
jgi:mono/diheme cytochrome c family protein